MLFIFYQTVFPIRIYGHITFSISWLDNESPDIWNTYLNHILFTLLWSWKPFTNFQCSIWLQHNILLSQWAHLLFNENDLKGRNTSTRHYCNPAQPFLSITIAIIKPVPRLVHLRPSRPVNTCAHLCRGPIDCDIQYLCSYNRTSLSGVSSVNYGKNVLGWRHHWIHINQCEPPTTITFSATCHITNQKG